MIRELPIAMSSFAYEEPFISDKISEHMFQMSTILVRATTELI
jgi:hypothetical protein